MRQYFIHSLFLLCLLSLVGCASQKKVKRDRTYQKQRTHVRTKAPKSKLGTRRSSMVSTAERLIGTPYKYGGTNTKGFDCSGFVRYVYEKAGYTIQGASRHLATQGKSIPKSEAKPGDLLFFAKNGKVFHVSMVVENKRNDLWVVHSTSSRGVIKENIFASSYWKNKSYTLRQIVN